MKKLLLFTLFPFFQTQSIPCTLHQCNVGQIEVNVQDEIKEIQLFNIQIEDYHYLCQELKASKTLELQYASQGSGQQVYLFADGKLIQEELLTQGYANLNIANPTYDYGQEMIDASRHIRRSNASAYESFQKEPAFIGKLYWGIVFVLWLMNIILLKKQKKSSK